MMRRSLSVLLILCLLAALLAGCAGELPPLPTPPGKESGEAPEESVPPDESEVVVTAEPLELPEALELGFSLPTADDRGEELRWYFSGAEEFDCAFAYPAYCSQWFEKGALRFDPNWFFARMFFTSVLRDDENAPDALLDLLEPGKWGSLPEEGFVGTGWTALRELTLKYDTWRDWIAWETPERYFLLYGVCFDGREEVLRAIFETIAESFRTGAEMLSECPESGALLRQDESLELFFDGAALGGGSAGVLALRLRAVNRGEEGRRLTVSAYTADGQSFPFETECIVSADGEQLWTLSLPLVPGEGGAPFESLGFRLDAQGGEGEALFELPVNIELKR